MEQDSFLAAVRAGALADVRSLLEGGGVDVQPADCVEAAHPLVVAATHGHLDIVRLLVDRIADVNAPVTEGPFTGWTALMAAARAGHIPIIQMLLSNGANPNAQDKEGQSPLQQAAAHNQIDAIRVLTGRGATINLKGKKGRTPLHDAAAAGHIEAVRVLLDHGADRSLRSNDNLWPEQMARKSGHTEVADLLRDYTRIGTVAAPVLSKKTGARAEPKPEPAVADAVSAAPAAATPEPVRQSVASPIKTKSITTSPAKSRPVHGGVTKSQSAAARELEQLARVPALSVPTAAPAPPVAPVPAGETDDTPSAIAGQKRKASELEDGQTDTDSETGITQSAQPIKRRRFDTGVKIDQHITDSGPPPPPRPRPASVVAASLRKDTDGFLYGDYRKPTQKRMKKEKMEQMNVEPMLLEPLKPQKGSKVFQAERIVSQKRRDGENFYRVKWHGFDDSHNTWEPEANVTLDPELLVQWKREQKAKRLAAKEVVPPARPPPPPGKRPIGRPRKHPLPGTVLPAPTAAAAASNVRPVLAVPVKKKKYYVPKKQRPIIRVVKPSQVGISSVSRAPPHLITKPAAAAAPTTTTTTTATATPMDTTGSSMPAAPHSDAPVPVATEQANAAVASGVVADSPLPPTAATTTSTPTTAPSPGAAAPAPYVVSPMGPPVPRGVVAKQPVVMAVRKKAPKKKKTPAASAAAAAATAHAAAQAALLRAQQQQMSQYMTQMQQMQAQMQGHAMQAQMQGQGQGQQAHGGMMAPQMGMYDHLPMYARPDLMAYQYMMYQQSLSRPYHQ